MNRGWMRTVGRSKSCSYVWLYLLRGAWLIGIVSIDIIEVAISIQTITDPIMVLSNVFNKKVEVGKLNDVVLKRVKEKEGDK